MHKHAHTHTHTHRHARTHECVYVRTYRMKLEPEATELLDAERRALRLHGPFESASGSAIRVPSSFNVFVA